MTLSDLASILNADIEIIQYRGQAHRWVAYLDRCDVKEGSFLHGVYGEGPTPDAALQDYVKCISGTTIVKDAYEDTRMEVRVPALTP